MGGTGGNIAYNREEFERLIDWGLAMSPVSQVLIEESVIGWKEYELEVMRDLKDNVVIVCPIENFDPMGVHTGDSITVAPAMTLTDKEYQRMRDAALRIIREIGVDTGGSNIQFGINPDDGEMVVIEMNPRVSRSSALASKATGFPIAKIAAKLAVGYTLDEITNDITGVTKASFRTDDRLCRGQDPTICLSEVPRGRSDPDHADEVGREAMAIGRTFKESLQKAIRSLELELNGLASRFGLDRGVPAGFNRPEAERETQPGLRTPLPERLWYVADAMRLGFTDEDLFATTKIDPWFLEQVRELVEFEQMLVRQAAEPSSVLEEWLLWKAKELGFSDDRIAQLLICEAAAGPESSGPRQGSTRSHL